MAVVRVNVKEHYGTGEVWSDAGNETAAAEDVRQWCEENPPWEMRNLSRCAVTTGGISSLSCAPMEG